MPATGGNTCATTPFPSQSIEHDSRGMHTFGPDAATQAQGFLADKLRQKYNREHPDRPIVRMKFELVAPLWLKENPLTCGPVAGGLLNPQPNMPTF